MKKAIKIGLISLLTLFIVLLIAVFVGMWVVFSPSRLTPIVREQAAKYISCPTEIGKVELTFFSTFPEFGLQIDGVNLVNHMPQAPNDTLLSAKSATAVLELGALLKRNELVMKSIRLNDVAMHVFVDQNGKPNYDVFITDTTTQDTSAFQNPFKKIDLQSISLRKANISYVDLSSKMTAGIQNLNGNLSFEMIGNQLKAQLDASTKNISFRMDSVDYLKKASVKLSMPFDYDMDKSVLTLRNTQLTLNGLKANATGVIQQFANNDNVFTDLSFSTEPYSLKSLISLIPATYASSMEGMKLDGVVSSIGTVKGIYNEKSMPLILLNADLDKGTFAYESLPTKLHDISGNADVRIDMNNEKSSQVELNHFAAKTDHSEFEGSGLIAYILMDDMLVDLDLKMDMNLQDLNAMMPEDMNMKLRGFAKGSGNVRFMLSDAMNMNLQKMNIRGKFDAYRFGVSYDTLALYANKAKLDIKIPNTQAKATRFMDAKLWSDKLKMNYGNGMAATILNANMRAQTTDLTQTERMNTINCDFRFDQMSGSMDGMLANLDQSKGKLTMKMNFNDSVTVPDVACDFDVMKLKANVDDTTAAEIAYPKGKFRMYADKDNPAVPVFDIAGTTGEMAAVMGADKFKAQNVDINTNVIYHGDEQDMMKQFIPSGTMALHNGTVTTSGLNSDILIPTIQLEFSPDMFDIKDSRFIVENSDFNLSGKLWNLDAYLKEKGLLKGDFNFTSNTTDVYQLMTLTNGFGVDDDTTSTATTKAVADSSSTGPYMVPKGIDVALHANVKQALLGFDTAHNVLGDMYVRDGILVLQDMRFVASTAKMQLTAMYKSPRRNHLFAGIDMHMTDLDIHDLQNMIPEVDSIMPMLRSFKGKGEFHMAVETYMDSLYNIKKSTLRGAASIKGENLVLMDGETFTEIAKTLRFSKKAENKVDSLSAEFTILKNEVDIYPFLIVMDKYKAVVSGKHNLDMSFDYHISVVDSPLPFRLGVNVKGNMDQLMNHPLECIRPAKCKYANMYRPAARTDVDIKQLELRKAIRDALTKEVIKQ